MKPISQLNSSAKRRAAAVLILFAAAAMARPSASAAEPPRTAAGHPAEGKLESFFGDPNLEIQQIHRGGRFATPEQTAEVVELMLRAGYKDDDVREIGRAHV